MRRGSVAPVKFLDGSLEFVCGHDRRQAQQQAMCRVPARNLPEFEDPTDCARTRTSHAMNMGTKLMECPSSKFQVPLSSSSSFGGSRSAVHRTRLNLVELRNLELGTRNPELGTRKLGTVQCAFAFPRRSSSCRESCRPQQGRHGRSPGVDDRARSPGRTDASAERKSRLPQCGDVDRSARTAARVGRASRLGLTTDFFVRTAPEWQAIVEANPFPKEAKADPSHLVAVVLKAAPQRRRLTLCSRRSKAAK